MCSVDKLEVGLFFADVDENGYEQCEQLIVKGISSSCAKKPETTDHRTLSTTPEGI
jgi:hypothetical protein